MSTENTPIVEPIEDDLDLFAADFFGQKEAPTESANSEENEDQSTEESDATTEDAHIDEDDTLENTVNDSDNSEDEEETSDEEEPKTPPKKNRFQERIDEVVGKQREAERKLSEALAELERFKQNVKPDPSTTTEGPKDSRPDPNDVNEDGSPKYPLGDFDPDFISDLVKYDFAKEQREAKAAQKAELEQQEMAQQQAALQAQWNEKLVPAKERYPDFEEKGQSLISTFDNIDAAYGEYLSATLMSMEYGPDVLYYLANHPDEAAEIVNSGATKATIALGRLEAKFLDAALEKQLNRPKISSAPTPPERINKGSSPVVPDIPDDTDDLDAFEKKFFKKRR